MAEIGPFLKEREKLGLLRFLKPASWRSQGKICLQNKEYLDFSSNDYLGLSEHPRLKNAAKKALEEFGVSSQASRLMSGDLELHHILEAKVAEWKNKEAALTFNSGYQANTGIISALFSKNDAIFFDRFAHASLIDGIILSQAKFFRFQHNDATDLESLLKEERHKFKKALIVTESIFSMDGDKAPLKELAGLKEKYDCRIYLDEAHATGVFGPSGAGLAQEQGVEEKIDFLMGTFSKALGSFGAYLASSKEIIAYLINTCRSFIYSTSLPPAIIAANICAMEVVQDEPGRRKILLENAAYFRKALKDKGFQVRGESQIVPLLIGENLKTLKFSQRLREQGYWVIPIRPPTVPNAQARVRFSLTSYHKREALEKLIDDIFKTGI